MFLDANSLLDSFLAGAAGVEATETAVTHV
jgi:hypothetical protein